MKFISIDSILLGPCRSKLNNEFKKMNFVSELANFRYVLMGSGRKLIVINNN